jgi:hypothetical protein
MNKRLIGGTFFAATPCGAIPSPDATFLAKTSLTFKDGARHLARR